MQKWKNGLEKVHVRPEPFTDLCGYEFSKEIIVHNRIKHGKTQRIKNTIPWHADLTYKVKSVSWGKALSFKQEIVLHSVTLTLKESITVRSNFLYMNLIFSHV